MLKTFIKLFALTGSILLLCSCGPWYESQRIYKNPVSYDGKRCVNRCLRDRSICQSDCDNTYQACVSNANDVARPAYRAYIQQQRRTNQPILKKIGDFADYSRCTNNCGCQPTYDQCFANCGGQIITNRVCVAFCDKAKPNTAKPSAKK